MNLRSVLTFFQNTAAQLVAAFTKNGQMGYQTDGTEGFYGLVAAVKKRFLMEGDIVATAPASETQTGVVQIATALEFAAGTDDDGAGSALVAKPSDIKAALDLKPNIAGDLAGTAALPLVQSSTQNSGLLLKDVAGTLQGRIKPTGAAELSVRDAADAGFAGLQTGDLTANGNVVITGNLAVSGTQTNVNSTDLAITDNEIVLNKDEAGAGVTLGTSGIRVERGTFADALLLFSESKGGFEAGIEGNLFDVVRKYRETLGAAATSHVVTHNLNTKDVQVAVWDGDELVACDVLTSTVNTVSLGFSVAVTGYRVVVTG